MTDQLQIENHLRTLAEFLEGTLEHLYDKQMGFMLIAFELGDVKGHADYIANGKREDMIKFLRETADRLEAKQDIPASLSKH